MIYSYCFNVMMSLLFQLLREITRAVPRDNIEPSSEDENKNRDPDIIASEGIVVVICVDNV